MMPWNVKGDDVPLQDLIPTMPNELELVKKTEGTLENYKNVSAEVLLLVGSKTNPFKRYSGYIEQSIAYILILLNLRALTMDQHRTTASRNQ